MAAKGGREGREDGSGSCIAGHRDQTGKLLCRPCQVSTRMCTSTHLQSKGESDSQLCLLPERRKPREDVDGLPRPCRAVPLRAVSSQSPRAPCSAQHLQSSQSCLTLKTVGLGGAGYKPGQRFQQGR